MLNFIKKYKSAIIVAAVIAAALVVAFISGGKISDVKDISDTTSAVSVNESVPTEASTVVAENTTAILSSSAPVPVTSAAPTTKAAEPSASASTAVTVSQPITADAPSKDREKDRYLTDPIPEGKPAPVEPQEQEVMNDEIVCTFSISCATILDNLDDLDEDKLELVPEDGWIYQPAQVTVNEGESVFDILVRICKENKIHMDYNWTPAYNSTYIEGIGNLYEFDCGGKSGWQYRVNGWVPNYGCSRYVPENGDVIEFLYTCNLGRDIGDNYYLTGELQ